MNSGVASFLDTCYPITLKKSLNNIPKQRHKNHIRNKGDPDMVDAKVLETVNFFGAQLRNSGVRINNLILFGSSGTATTGSDIDIAIISEDFTNRDIFDRALLTKDAEMHTVKKFKVSLDVITLTPEEYQDQKSLIAGTIRKGITLPTVSLA
jgi:uncharacterized protein